MKNLNTSTDFINYARSNGFKKKDAIEFLQTLKEFCSMSIATNKDVLLKGIVKFQINKTTTTFKPGESFKKVKAYPAINLLKLSRKKG